MNQYTTRSGAVRLAGAAALLFGLFVAPAALAQDSAGALAEHKVMLDTVWTLIAAFLVFWMNAGFALVESGFCRKKNAVNILAKNFIVFGISALAYWFLGFALMFSDGNAFLGFRGFMMTGADNSPAIGEAYSGVYSALGWASVPLDCKFFFQLVFAGTAATIVSGAVAERIKFQAYLLFSFLLVAGIYPITGHWIWGGGLLSGKGFHDFAGSTQVHSVGGWAALVGICVLGPRTGKYRKDGAVHPIPGHSMTSAALGGLILWLGWFGFNPGSTMAADFAAIAHISVTTALAASTGAVVSCLYAWLRIGKPDLSMIINGCLAGLVAITAPCDGVSGNGSIVIGAVAGVLVIESVLFFDRIRVDDPVGALSVHLVNGIWGTLAYGLFNTQENADAGWSKGLFYGGGWSQLLNQAYGVLIVGGFVVILSLFVWWVTRALLGMRVSPEEEYIGLDVSEMGLEAYPEDVETPQPIGNSA